MMELKQKNKLTNASVSSFVGGVLRNTENSVFTCTILVYPGSIPVKTWWEARFDSVGSLVADVSLKKKVRFLR
jgi:hypothetical protein